MPNTMTSTDMAVRIRSIGLAAQKAQRRAVGDAALIVKRSIEREAAIATKGSMGYSNMTSVSTRSGRMRTVPKGNARLSVGYDIVGVYKPTALLVARGPWGIVEFGSEPHTIVPKLPTIQRKGRSKESYRLATIQRRLDVAFGVEGTFAGLPPLAATAGGGKPVYRVNHRGQRPRRPFRKGLERSREQAAKRASGIVSGAVVDTIRSGRQTITYIRGEVGPVGKTNI